jgi:hypothetical protein
MAFVLLLMPISALAAVPAQADGLDPAILQAIQIGASQVAQASGVATGPAQPVLQVETPTEEPAETPAEVVIPTLDDFAESSSAGVSLLAPEQWTVAEGEFGNLFEISEETAGVKGMMTDLGTDFPSLLVFPLFGSNADMLISSMSEGAEATGVSRIDLEQGLPAIKIGFTGVEDEELPESGAIYLIATGAGAYGLFLGSDTAMWPEMEVLTDSVARSVVFDDEEISLAVAAEDGTEFEDPEGVYSLSVPAGWYQTGSGDLDLRVVIADPAISVVGALAVETGLQDDEQLKAMTEAIAGALSDEAAAELLGAIVETLDLGADGDVTVDEEQTKVFPSVGGESLGTIRIVGETQIEDGPAITLTMYVSVYPDKVAALVVFGDPADVQAQEETILGIVDSITFAE